MYLGRGKNNFLLSLLSFHLSLGESKKIAFMPLLPLPCTDSKNLISKTLKIIWIFTLNKPCSVE